MASRPAGLGAGARRLTTETKQFFKTSEFWVYLVILIAGLMIEGEEGGPDIFNADDVWRWATVLTAAYLISRGLAKSGVRDPYWDNPDDHRSHDGAPIGERVKAAAQVLTEGPDSVGSGQHQQQHQQHQPQQHQPQQTQPLGQTQALGQQPPPPGQNPGY